MRVDDLRKELGRLGLPTEGKKGALVSRLEEHRKVEEEKARPCSWVRRGV